MNKNIKYSYIPDLDILNLSCWTPDKGQYDGGWDITGDSPVGLVADITTAGRCIGIEFWNAAELLLPHLLPDEFQPSGIKTALQVEYCQETGTLHIGNGRAGDYSEAVAEGWTAHYDTGDTGEYPVGEIVGITLENAAREFLPDLLRHESGEFWGPDKAERMRRLRKASHVPARDAA